MGVTRCLHLSQVPGICCSVSVLFCLRFSSLSLFNVNGGFVWCTSCAWLVPMEPEEGIGFPETGVTDSFEPLSGGLKPNPGPLKEQSLLLPTETFLQPLF